MRCLLWIEAGGGGMLTVETIGRIRRERFLKGKTIKEGIVTETDCDAWLVG